MIGARERTQVSYLAFLVYLDETGLDAELREICRAHHVAVRDVYLDERGPTVHAARIECWWWLLTAFRKSQGEVARMFDRDDSSITYSMRKLGAAARVLGVPLDPTTVRQCATAMAQSAHANRREAGSKVAELGTGAAASVRSRAIKSGR